MVKEARPFRHEALFYADEADFLGSTLPFVQEGVEAGEAVLVAAPQAKIDLLSAHLGGHADSVLFTDMARIGANPARIIPVWRRFVDEQTSGGRQARGIGEPVWSGRRGTELVECERHEALINVAFADSPPLWLLCPYDANALDPAVLEGARHTHPMLRQGATQQASAEYDRVGPAAAPLHAPLPEPPDRPLEVAFDAEALDRVRRHVSSEARRAGLSSARMGDLVLAVNEVANNSIRHGGGGGVLRIWQEGEGLICEVRDQGHLSDPLVGRVHPSTADGDGWGLWLVNQLCDVVQLRSFDAGTAARLHMWLDGPTDSVWQSGMDLRRPHTSPAEPAAEGMEALPIAMHEVRRPLGLALSYLSMLSDEAANRLDAHQHKLLQEAEGRLSDLRRQLDQLMLLGRVLAGGTASTLEPCDLETEVEQAIDNLRVGAELAGGRLTVERPRAGARAMANHTLLRQVVENLVHNAMKYSQGAPEIRVEIGSFPQPYIRVIDHGIGIDQRTASAIFNMGVRGKGAEVREGSGLGLFLSRRAASRMQGELTLAWTKPGAGSIFQLSLQPEDGGSFAYRNG